MYLDNRDDEHKSDLRSFHERLSDFPISIVFLIRNRYVWEREREHTAN